jgi:hypothetical protein
MIASSLFSKITCLFDFKMPILFSLFFPKYTKLFFSSKNSFEMASLLRIDRELRDARKLVQRGLKVIPVAGEPLHWLAEIMGPVGSAYEGGTFKLDIK